MTRWALIVVTLILSGSTAFADGKRTQEPERPFPYHEEEVTYAGSGEGIQLTGTLTVPRKGGPFPAIYLIPGGTPFGRDQDMLGHKTFLVLSDHLTRHGFAVLRMDDRGIGGSTGKKMTSSLEDIAGDVMRGLDFLATRENIDASRIGVLGHSAGGILAPLVASRDARVSFVVMLAGAGQPFIEVLALQSVEDGIGNEELNLELADLAIGVLESDPAAGFEEVAELWKAHAADLTEEQADQIEALTGEMRPGLGLFLSQPFLRDLLIFDAGISLEATTCPTLALGGEFDPMKVTLPRIEAALEARTGQDHRVELLPGLNHMFQTCTEPGSPREWAALEETFSPMAMELLTGWIQEHTGTP